MSDELNFVEKFEQNVSRKREFVEKNTLPKLRDSVTAFKTYFESIFNILKRKSLFQDDPYKDDEKISEVLPPSSEPFMESEKDDEMSKRLSYYHLQLEFLSNYYQLSLDFLDLKRLKGIVDLFKYINWMNFTPTSMHLETRYVAELVQKVKMGSDPISTQIMVDALAQLERNVRQMFIYLEEIIFILKEIYKLELRTKLLPNLTKNLKALVSNPPEFLKDKELKVLFMKSIPGKAYYPDLIREIIEEDFAANGAELRSMTLKKLEVKEEQKKKTKKKTDFKGIILQGLRILASAGFQIEDAINKLNDNHTAYVTRKMTIGERFALWFKKIVSGKNQAQKYEINYFDITSSSTRSERISYLEFIEELQKKSKLFSALSNRASAQYHRIETGPEDQVYQFLTKNIASLQIEIRRLAGLNDFFKSEILKEKKGKFRGINIEINAVRNSIVKANKIKHEYMAAKEEQEQMKRLGIKVEEL